MSQSEARFSIRTLLLTALVTIVVTVMTLEINGRILHNENKDDMAVGEFTALHLIPGEEGVRMSPKSSELHAVCEQGYLAIASDTDAAFRAVLLDYKNRGVRCGEIHTFVAPDDMTAPQAAEGQ
ncbi:kinase [Marinobacter mobilis]|uniref:Kinase n=1 Tax=Marinobacter mobilis TaxID=488533 RepID=A0A1H2T9L5_9GAMM|nr:kinase [Marinobacter mobilis]SDW40518.1 hypothetical protein SAMN04487960_102374 [Marinobacter mobilis]